MHLIEAMRPYPGNDLRMESLYKDLVIEKPVRYKMWKSLAKVLKAVFFDWVVDQINKRRKRK